MGFVDLGSGRGNAVLAAHLSGLFVRCVGVELLKPLFECANAAWERLRVKHPGDVSFINEDLRGIDLCGYDVIFMSSLTWCDDVLACLASSLTALKAGSQVISLRKLPLNEVEFQLVLQERCLMRGNCSSV